MFEQISNIADQLALSIQNAFSSTKTNLRQITMTQSDCVDLQQIVNEENDENKLRDLHVLARDCEKQVYISSGLDENLLKNLQIKDVQIDSNHGKDQWIHMVKLSDDPTKPKIVLVHGFAASSLSYYKMIGPLSKKYEVYAIDLPGMGLSSKPHWRFEGPEPVIEFFVESVEEWRREMGIEKFTMVGHSLGGYISGHYSLNHPDRVEKLVMLSSAGVTKQTDEDIQKHMESSPLHYQIWFKVFDVIWRNQLTFNRMYKEVKVLPTEFIMRQYMKMLDLPSHEFEPWSQYMDKMLLLPESGEKCVYNMLQFPRVNAFLPFEELFPNRLKVPVHFLYGGEQDWMCSNGAKNLVMSGKVHGTYTQFDHFNHQFPFFNPIETSNFILGL